MKSILWIALGVSAIVNTALLVGDPRQSRSVRPVVPEAAPVPEAMTPNAQGGDAAAFIAQLPADLVAPGMAFESTDLAAYRDRLRGAGFPDWAVAALVGRRIDAHFDEVRRQRLGPTAVEPFWKSPDPAREQQRRQVTREIWREQAAMRREILGSVSDTASMYRSNRFAFLPPEKVDLIARLESDYAELSGDVRMEGGGRVMLEEDREKLSMIEREKRADLVAALTPEELEAYDLRHSRTAQNVRSRMGNFDPTEEEFLAVYALQKVFDEQFPSTSFGMDLRSSEEMKARRDAEAELKAQIKAALGEQRYVEYERSSDYGYQSALKIVDHFKLPRENAASVYTLEREYRQRQSEAMRGHPQQAARNEALAALAAEASARVVALLGEDGAKAFKQTGGHWLRNLEQQAQRATSAAARP